jgi:hypothetical protein
MKILSIIKKRFEILHERNSGENGIDFIKTIYLRIQDQVYMKSLRVDLMKNLI